VVTGVPQAALDELVRDVEDPELPHVTIGDLGIVRSVAIHGDTATVVLTPTYTGCPATEQIRDDVTAVVSRAGYTPHVRMVMSPAWTTDWISERGRQRLHAAGIAPPRPADHRGARETMVEPPLSCPRCNSRRTRLVSQFGSTACKASYTCTACGEPFELFKSI
jgi:ring-1,2-phenylacetyl-CoA epoxidase subunit PaaD